MKACACEFQDVINDIRILIGNVAITQIPVSSNDNWAQAQAAGDVQEQEHTHRITGAKVCELVVCCPVRVLRPLDMNMNRDFSIPQKLINFEAE
eukprot:scaffold9190_cov81-Skeletonema_dohrnii-CCMP3373.AAC.4